MTADTPEISPHDAILREAAELGLTMTAVFVPWSQSRNKGEKYPSLNWLVTIERMGKPIITTDYMAGCAHAPSYKQMDRSLDRAALVEWECEHGKRGREPREALGRSAGFGIIPASRDSLTPDFADVLHSLALDYDVLDHGSYEEWASDFGYDPDSRKGETVYRACLELALKLRAGIGNAGMERLRTVSADY